jgi:hypothetical protein
MKKTPLALLLGVLATACGQLVSMDEKACPCASGYTCCNAVCVAGACPNDSTDEDTQALCPGALALGTQSVPSDDDASVVPSVQTVTGQATSSLVEGATTPFSYATSVWPKPYGWQLNGWFVTAASGESLTFRLWADDDAGTVPLSLVLYGPLEGVETQSCTGAIVGDGALVGSDIAWTAGAQGTYFAAAYHSVVETQSGLAFEGLNDSNYARAFIVMTGAK